MLWHASMDLYQHQCLKNFQPVFQQLHFRGLSNIKRMAQIDTPGNSGLSLPWVTYHNKKIFRTQNPACGKREKTEMLGKGEGSPPPHKRHQSHAHYLIWFQDKDFTKTAQDKKEKHKSNSIQMYLSIFEWTGLQILPDNSCSIMCYF